MLQKFLMNGWRNIGLMLMVIHSSGCHPLLKRADWRSPTLANSKIPHQQVLYKLSGSLAADAIYADAIRRERNVDVTCVDLYFQAARLAWLDVESGIRENGCTTRHTNEIYSYRSLIVKIDCGERFRIGR